MKSKKIAITVAEGESVSAILTVPETVHTGQATGIIFAHGAANDMNTPLIVAVSEGLAQKGFVTLRFNFPYREKGRKSPDSQGKLVQTWKSVYDHMKSRSGHRIEKVIAVGKSMGGRVASQMAADGQMELDRLIFLGYPLHASGRKDRLKDEHLYRIGVPMLFFAGTRDPLCDLNSLNGVLKKLACEWALEIIEGGDHAFRLPRSDPRTNKQVYAQVLTKCIAWLGPG